MDAMKIKAIAPWFGGKRTMAPLIVEELGKHTQYFEPFCGSMAVLFAKEPSRQETVNDLHGDLINLARVMQHEILGARLYRRLRRAPLSDDILTECRQAMLCDWGSEKLDIDRAFAFFVLSWMGRNGEAGLDHVERSGRLCVRWTANGGDPAVRFRGTVESIPGFRRRMRNLTILRRDAFEIIPKFANVVGCSIYVDPPYIKKSDRYMHDFEGGFMGSADDHARLRDCLCRFTKSRVVVSYYDHPRVRELYAGWTFVDHSRAKHTSNASGGNGKAPEVLIINGPSYAK